MSATTPNFESVWKILQKTSILQAETSKQLEKLEVSQAETSKQIKEFQVSQVKTDEKLNKIGILVGGVGNNQGDVAEEFYFNTLKANPELNGLRFDYIEKNVTRSHKKLEDEFDILMVNGSDVFIIEVKYKAHKNDLERLLNKKAVNFKKLYPEFSNYRHHLGLATFHINDELKEEALQQGVTILQRKGKVIETYPA
ncbi:MAG: hypothetical protein ACPG44_03545 [Polaribacter sp.]